MAKQIVKYHNDLNGLIFKRFSVSDYALFFAICFCLKGTDGQNVTLPFSRLRKLAGLDKNYTNEEFAKILAGMNKKLLEMDLTLINKHHIIGFSFFRCYYVDPKRKVLVVGIHGEGVYVLSKLRDNFTTFELTQYTELKSKYSMTLYRLLKQFRKTGYLRMDSVEFQSIMCIPEKYSHKTLMQKVIKPAINDLKDEFPGLHVDFVRDSTKRGRPIIAYEFKFEKDEKVQENDDAVIYSATGAPYQIMQTFDTPKRPYKGKNAAKRKPVEDDWNPKPIPDFLCIETNDYDFEALEKILLGQDAPCLKDNEKAVFGQNEGSEIVEEAEPLVLEDMSAAHEREVYGFTMSDLELKFAEQDEAERLGLPGADRIVQDFLDKANEQVRAYNAKRERQERMERQAKRRKAARV